LETCKGGASKQRREYDLPGWPAMFGRQTDGKIVYLEFLSAVDVDTF